MSLLPPELIINILLRISLKALCTYKCVSKQWRNIISDPYFQNLYNEQSKMKRSPQVLYSTNPETLQILYEMYHATTDPPPHKSELDSECTFPVTISMVDFFSGDVQNRFTISVQSSPNTNKILIDNGLMCLFSDMSIYICNPSTQEFLRLPDPPRLPLRYNGEGLGYDPTTKVFKVVIFSNIIGHERRSNIGGHVFCIKNGGSILDSYWREIKNIPSSYSMFSDPTCVDGVIYWFVKERKRKRVERIVSFDLEDEVFGDLELPSRCFNNYLNNYHMVDLNGSLGLVFREHGSEILHAWTLLCEDDRTWENKYCIDPLKLGYRCKILGLIPSCKEEEDLLIWISFDYLSRYDVVNKSFTRVEYIDVPRYRVRGLCFDYFFSLGSSRSC